MIKLKEDCSLVFIILVLVFLIVLMLGFLIGSTSQSAHLAAWVQAIGSIGAIVSAIYVMRLQLQHQIEVQEKESKKHLREIVVFLRVAVNTIFSLSDEFEPSKRDVSVDDNNEILKVFRVNKYKEWSIALNAIDLSQRVIIEIAPKIINLRLQVKVLSEMAKNETPSYSGSEVAAIKGFLKDIEQSLKSLGVKERLFISEKEVQPLANNYEVIVPSSSN